MHRLCQVTRRNPTRKVKLQPVLTRVPSVRAVFYVGSLQEPDFSKIFTTTVSSLFIFSLCTSSFLEGDRQTATQVRHTAQDISGMTGRLPYSKDRSSETFMRHNMNKRMMPRQLHVHVSADVYISGYQVGSTTVAQWYCATPWCWCQETYVARIFSQCGIVFNVTSNQATYAMKVIR